jgi:hypothetical protein
VCNFARSGGRREWSHTRGGEKEAGTVPRGPGRQYEAEQECAADCLQPALRSGFQQRLTPGVRLRRNLTWSVSCHLNTA